MRSGNGGYRVCLPCNQDIQERFCPGRFLAINDHDIVVEDLKDSFEVFKMMFGVSRGNQDVVDIDECVRDVA